MKIFETQLVVHVVWPANRLRPVLKSTRNWPIWCHLVSTTGESKTTDNSYLRGWLMLHFQQILRPLDVHHPALYIYYCIGHLLGGGIFGYA